MAYEKQSERIEALERQVESLTKSLSEAEGAVRRLAQQQESNITLLSRLNEDLGTLRAELMKAQNALSRADLYENSVTRYE